MRRIVVTGLGVICALGRNADEMWASLAAGRCGVGPITIIDPRDLKIAIAAEVKGFRPEDHLDERSVAQIDRFAQFAVVAAREAMTMARLTVDPAKSGRIATVLGSGVGGLTTLDDNFRRLYEQKLRVHPLCIPRYMSSAGASHVTMQLGLLGPAFSVSSACASANHAIAVAAMMLRGGLADVAVTGGSEATITYGTMKGWEALRVMTPDVCRPFSAGRRGMVLGEGAGVFVLETLEHATARGTPILAELAGVGMSADAGDLTAPSAEGAAQAMRAALEDARLAPEDIQYINAHGTGTLANDATETKAVKALFGAHAHKLAISSTKSMHGHLLGGAGGVELAATLLAMQHGMAPPTIGYEAPDPDCDLDYVPNVARKLTIDAALSNSFAFGGLNAVIAVRKFHG